MKLVLIDLPFLMSFLVGSLAIHCLFGKPERPPLAVQLFLGGGLGLGISGHLTFSSFILLGRPDKLFLLAAHLLLIAILIWLIYRKNGKRGSLPLQLPLREALPSLGPLLLLCCLLPLVWIQAKYYPFGGWDAWSVWNYKAKFLFLAGDRWLNLFDPKIWWSSPHYPLLLPLINVWGWLMINETTYLTPLLTSVIFTFLTAGLLWAALWHMTGSAWSIWAPLLLLTMPFYNQTATSQYADIVVGYYILAALFCWIKASAKAPHTPYVFLAVVFLGFLTFAKPEGMVAALLLGLWGLLSLWRDRQFYVAEFRKSKKRYLLLLGGAGLAVLPTVIFQLFLSPGNQTFINGFTSSTHPVDLYRLKMIPAYLLMELISDKWNGLWMVLLTGIVLAAGRGFKREIRIVPLFLFSYLGIILFYYLLNTYFEIAWWLQVTLSRILFSLLPAFLLWIFYYRENEKSRDSA